MPGYISHILHASSVSYGITDMFYGIGGLVAGLITAKLLEKMTKKNLLIDFFLIASLALLALFNFKLNLLTFAATFLIVLNMHDLLVRISIQLMCCHVVWAVKRFDYCLTISALSWSKLRQQA